MSAPLKAASLAVVMLALRGSDVVLITGKRGSGKSTKAKELAASEIRHGHRVVAFDPHDEYSVQGKKTKAVTLGPLKRRVTLERLLEHPEILREPGLSLAVVPSNGTMGVDLAEDFADLVSMIEEVGDVTFIADEVGDYSKYANAELEHIGTQSRHWNVPLVLVSQRAIHVPKTARDQVSILFAGVQSDADDLKALAKVARSPDFAEAVSRLPRPGILTWREQEK